MGLTGRNDAAAGRGEGRESSEFSEGDAAEKVEMDRSLLLEAPSIDEPPSSDGLGSGEENSRRDSNLRTVNDEYP